uniref:DUF202 domain-containing protein n=1 Tax=Caldisericum exile TaxID=693075 RepID=A0A7C4TVQ4_9BACT
MAKKWRNLSTEEIYERLTILDGKCSALLELSAIILTIGTIPITSGKFSGLPFVLSLIITVTFLLVSILSLTVIWVEWEPTIKTLNWRTIAYRISVILSGAGLFLIAILIFAVSLM